MKQRHNRDEIEQEMAAKEAADAEGDVSETTLAEEDGETSTSDADTMSPESVGSAEKDRAIAELTDALLRLSADFDNFRRRTQREKEQLYTDSVADVVREFLPVLDNLERAAGASQDSESLSEGIARVLRQANDALTKLGVEEVPAAGRAFDPNLHNAIAHVEDETRGAGEVVEVFMKGYRCGERVIRHSMVKVAN